MHVEEEIAEERELSRAEKILAVAMVIFLFLATWEALFIALDEIGGMLPDERVLFYGVSIPVAMASILAAPRLRGFKRIYGNVLMGYGLLLLVCSVGMFILDCLPEVGAALAGAAGSGAGIWYVRRKYFTPERVMRSRLSKDLCPFCGRGRVEGVFFCPECGRRVALKCERCGARVGVFDRFCPMCGAPVSKSSR